MDEKPDSVFPLVEKIIEHGYELRFFYKELILHFRNLLLVKSVADPKDLLPLRDEDIEGLKQESKKASSEEILRFLLALQQGEQGLRFSTHPRIYLETLLVKLCHYRKIVPLKDLIDELEDMKKEIAVASVQKKISADSSLKEGWGRSNSFSEDLPGEVRMPDSKAQDIKPTKIKEKPSIKGVKEKEADMAVKDPAVQDFMKTFKAQIISVEPIKGTKRK